MLSQRVRTSPLFPVSSVHISSYLEHFRNLSRVRHRLQVGIASAVFFPCEIRWSIGGDAGPTEGGGDG